MWRRKPSAAWDSIVEIPALAHNSRPSEHALLNTSAGIQCIEIFGMIAVIRATDDAAGSVEGTADEIRPP